MEKNIENISSTGGMGGNGMTCQETGTDPEIPTPYRFDDTSGETPVLPVV